MTASTSRVKVTGSLSCSVQGGTPVRSSLFGRNRVGLRGAAPRRACASRGSRTSRGPGTRARRTARRACRGWARRCRRRRASAARASARTGRSASATVLPLTLSVSSEAEATEIAQPLPSNDTSLMRSPSSFTYSVSWSPHSGLKPSACAIGVRHRAEIARIAVVIDDDVAVEVLEVHQPSISRAVCRASTSRSISARVL